MRILKLFLAVPCLVVGGLIVFIMTLPMAAGMLFLDMAEKLAKGKTK